VEHLADHGIGCLVHESRAELLHQMAGRKCEQSAERASEARFAARRASSPGQGRRGAVSLTPVAPAGTASPAGPAAPALDRRRARRRADWRRRRLVLVLMSPWIVGFTVFFGYPLVMSAYLSFNHYDLLSPPRWVGLANYRYLLHVDPQVWTAVRNT